MLHPRPPETAKTTTILTIVKAILHHSGYGHVRRAQYEEIPFHQGMLRCGREGILLWVLFVSSSNASVDNILLRLHRNGIPDG